MRIGELARAGGVGVETVRYYQRRGLIAEPVRGEGIRRYGADDVHRLRFIRRAQEAGFTLKEIAELVALDGGEDRARVHALATARIAALDRQIALLRAARDALARLATECGGSGSGGCPILSAFSETASAPRT